MLSVNSLKQGGQIQAVYGYNKNNEYIGKSTNHLVKDGDVHTFTLDQYSPGVQAEYISLSNWNDGTCVAWVAVNMKDTSQGGVWTGDIGRECGQRWHDSGQTAGQYPDGSDYIPACKSSA